MVFSRTSRYRKLNNVVADDSKGRPHEVKEWRLLPEAEGFFEHTVQQTDRLPNLAFKFYTRPTKWWRICDANPSTLSPFELLENEPVVVERHEVSYSGPATSPPLPVLLRNLRAMVGVASAVVQPSEEITPTTFSVLVRYNRHNRTPADITAAVTAAGFTTADPASVGRTGKPIVIPPDVLT